MAVQFSYLGQQGWKPPNPDQKYLITLLQIEISSAAKEEGQRQGKSERTLFEDAAASIAAESSTGTWTKVYDGPDSGIMQAEKERAIAYDLNYEKKMFKVAYPVSLFELDNISGILAGIVGNIAGMKMISGMRIHDVRFPGPMIRKFLGPQFGVPGVRKLLKKPRGPLLVTVPKPKIGRNAKEQAALAKILFTAGDGSYEGIKDDENLTNLSFNRFEERARLVLKELKIAEKMTKRKKFYLCNVSHSNIEVMKKRAAMIKKNGGVYMMMDVICTGFTAVDSLRRARTGLAIHGHRAMHAFITRESSSGIHGNGPLSGFSISMILLAKIFRLLGVDSLHGGSPLAKMEDYGEAVYIQKVLQEKDIRPHDQIPTLGQKWYHIKPVWMVASGGLHPGDFETVIKTLGEDIIIQCGGGVLGHSEGIVRGVEAAQEARNIATRNIPFKTWVNDHPKSALASAVKLWGYGPRIVY